MNVKVQLDGIPDFLKRPPAADVAKIEGATEKPAGADEAAGEAAEPSTLPPDNAQREQARIERFAKIAKREQTKAASKVKTRRRTPPHSGGRTRRRPRIRRRRLRKSPVSLPEFSKRCATGYDLDHSSDPPH